ncbi:tetratricopeptide repeat protein [Novipirellula sp.]|uniref:tetratricopeptide repeat protein n=1 Tax=Novipirellula sp. TaxID=2795430 RepID=UPI003567A664
MTHFSLRLSPNRYRSASTKVVVLVLGSVLSALVIADVSLTRQQVATQLPAEVQTQHPAPVVPAIAGTASRPDTSIEKTPTVVPGLHATYDTVATDPVASRAESETRSEPKIATDSLRRPAARALDHNTTADNAASTDNIESMPSDPSPVTRTQASFVFNRRTTAADESAAGTTRAVPSKFATHLLGSRNVTQVSNSEPPLLPIPVNRRVKSQATLPYTTSMESQLKCRQLLDQASHEYRVKAWLSAETSTWAALTHAVEGIQIATRESDPQADDVHDPLLDLQRARTALTEVRDFAEQSTSSSQIEMETIVRSHRTKVLRHVDLDGMTSTQAIEAYLDDARQTLAKLASESVQAAEAMDLLAAIYLTRDDKRTLPSSTSLCLRRAALQGQPQNATLASNLGMQLARVGMLTEAKRVLEHSVSLQNDPTTQSALATVLQQLGQFEQAAKVQVELQAANYPTTEYPNGIRIPEVIQLTPAEFAAVSSPVMQSPAASPRSASQVPAIAVSTKQNHVTNTSTGPGHPNTIYTDASASGAPVVPSMSDVESISEPTPSALRRTWNSVRNLW